MGRSFRFGECDMMSFLRGITARKLIRALRQDGFELKRTSGSHHLYQHSDGRRVVIAYHHSSDTFPIGTLEGMIEDVRWTTDDPLRLGLL